VELSLIDLSELSRKRVWNSILTRYEQNDTLQYLAMTLYLLIFGVLDLLFLSTSSKNLVAQDV
jgi:hypothetical protein